MKAHKEDKKITIDQLAAMVQKGFEKTATKADIEKLATKVQVQAIDERLKNVEEKLENIGDLRPRVKKLEEALEIE